MRHADNHLLLASPVIRRFDTLLGETTAGLALTCLDETLDWQQPRLRLFGREHPIPRRQVWMGDAEARYRYSGQIFSPDSWHPIVLDIRNAVIARLDRAGIVADFNSVLLNRYGTGQERMGWHSDDEPELGSTPLIAAVSLGCERPLRFRWKHKEGSAFNVCLPHDSLLVMGPGVQARLQHALLSRRAPGLRISLTFRWVYF
ncbi:alpha-ketoglutarate-dependent dioxygenase AlkB [Halomonas sp. TRM85114]|uniref:alpha-ketoglutarate-dependent dioxygenase AlkB family protein n=1 Tax=Halomonas jincaotanensis TaxID=2810616 RepID=UPI001BD4F973|nr:alpha-ketoglutarate-dependent dioxygenase AlkB [Halomonas jincaotanensis]MBS9402643.1 alpha-ketoglutarate-dependent dioxygenase AlkB [Halomonas jincaotanensis]